MQLKELFDSIDLGGNGLISLIDLRAFIFNYTQFNAQNNTLYHIISEYDSNMQGGISFEDFIRIAKP